MTVDQITYEIIACALRVHTELGPGLLESAYEGSLEYDLTRTGLYVQRQKLIALSYGAWKTRNGYRPDLIVENKVIVEVKAVKKVDPIFATQLNTYLKLTNLQVGLLINFNVQWLKTGITRIINPSFTARSDPHG